MSRGTLSLLAFWLFTGIAFAQSISSNSQVFGIPENNTSAYLSAVGNANTSSTVIFRYDITTTELPWTWTVNVTDTALEGSNSSSGQKITYTSYSFGWPYVNLDIGRMVQLDVNESRSGADTRPLHIYAAQHFILPQNVSAAWNSSQESSCQTPLGSACVVELLRVMVGGARGAAYQEACQGSFYTDGKDHLDIQSFPLYPQSSTYSSVAVNHTFSYSASEPYAAGNDSVYQARAHALHVVAIEAPGSTQLHCNRAVPVLSSATSTNSSTSSITPSQSSTVGASTPTSSQIPSSTTGAAVSNVRLPAGILVAATLEMLLLGWTM